MFLPEYLVVYIFWQISSLHFDRIHLLSPDCFSVDQNSLEPPITTQVGVKEVIFDLVFFVASLLCFFGTLHLFFGGPDHHPPIWAGFIVLSPSSPSSGTSSSTTSFCGGTTNTFDHVVQVAHLIFPTTFFNVLEDKMERAAISMSNREMGGDTKKPFFYRWRCS